MANPGKPIAIVCAICGSKHVSRDAWGEWDEDRQEWVLRTVFDFAYCHHCDGETRLEEIELKPRRVRARA